MKNEKPEVDNARRWATASTRERLELLQLAELEGRQAAIAGLPREENYYNEMEGELRAAWAAGYYLGLKGMLK